MKLAFASPFFTVAFFEVLLTVIVMFWPLMVSGTYTITLAISPKEMLMSLVLIGITFIIRMVALLMITSSNPI